MPFVTYDDKTLSDIEFEEVDYNELTSCYTYNPLFTAIRSQNKTVKDDNNYFQWIEPNEEIRFEKSSNDSYLDIIWIYNVSDNNFQATGTLVLGDNQKIKVITKMNLKNYRFVVDTLFTTLTDDNIDHVEYQRNAQTYTEL